MSKSTMFGLFMLLEITIVTFLIPYFEQNSTTLLTVLGISLLLLGIALLLIILPLIISILEIVVDLFSYFSQVISVSFEFITDLFVLIFHFLIAVYEEISYLVGSRKDVNIGSKKTNSARGSDNKDDQYRREQDQRAKDQYRREQDQRAKDQYRREQENYRQQQSKNEKKNQEDGRRSRQKNRSKIKSRVEALKIMNLNNQATKDEIKKAYRVLAKKYHPDTVDTLERKFKETANERMVQINNAYDYLTIFS